MKTERRWMKSILAAANDSPVTLPWARGTRRRPAALTPPKALKPQAIAAR